MNEEALKITIVKENIEKAIDGISGGFIWKFSKQGQEYWEKVIMNLMIIGESIA